LFWAIWGRPPPGLDYATPDGTAIRDYIHVSDLADAHGRALEYLREDGCSEFLNPGSSCGCSVLEVIKSARQVTEKPIRIRMGPPRPGHSSRLIADATKAESFLGWIPQQSDLSTILRSAWEWHLRNPRGYTTK
jgi:UDP-glucose 4-epimerase